MLIVYLHKHIYQLRQYWAQAQDFDIDNRTFYMIDPTHHLSQKLTCHTVNKVRSLALL